MTPTTCTLMRAYLRVTCPALRRHIARLINRSLSDD